MSTVLVLKAEADDAVHTKNWDPADQARLSPVVSCKPMQPKFHLLMSLSCIAGR